MPTKIRLLTELDLPQWVGVIIDTANSCSEAAPKSTVTAYRATELHRTGNLEFHKFGQSRIFNAFRPAIVNRATKKVDYWLDKDNPLLKADGTTSTPDWITQNICVIVPTIYRALVVVGTTIETRLDIAAFDGAELWHEESAHSIGFAEMDRTDSMLVSVISDDARFRGGNNDAGKDGTDATQIGRPATSISRTDFETYANNAGWEIGNIKDRTLWHELTSLYFGNTNIQLAFTNVLTAEGYPQGGMGAGVTTWGGDWGTWNGYYPIHNTGAGSMAVGCKVGVHSITVNGHTEEIPVFFFLEHLYGEIWDWVGEVNIEKSAEIANGGTGISSVYVCSEFAKRAATITADYTKVGEMARTDGYIKSLIPGWVIPLVTSGASDVAYMSDYGYGAGIPGSGVAVYGLLFGVPANYGAYAGVRCSNSSYVPAGTYSRIGARLRAKISH